MLSFETIQLARLALFERGNMRLDCSGHVGRMVGLNDIGHAEAEAYNQLASLAPETRQ